MTGTEDDLKQGLIEAAVTQMVALGGTLADPAQARERLTACERCELSSPDYTVAGIVVPGGRGITKCVPCGCIASAKASVRTYFSTSKMRVVPAVCPHPEGSRWEAIDQKYKT